MAKDTALRIQKKAIELFRGNGYPNTTIDDICRAAGVTKRTFYYYYASKDQLIRDFYENVSDLSPEMMRLLVSTDNSWKKLWALLGARVDWTNEAGTALVSQFIITSIQNGDNFFMLPNSSGLGKVYLEIIQKGLASGHFQNSSDPALVYDNVRNVIVGVSVHWCIDKGAFDLKGAVKERLISLLGVREDLLE